MGVRLSPVSYTHLMQVEVDKDDKTISCVEAIHIRDREFEPLAFRIKECALPEPVESYISKEKKLGRPTKEPFEPYKEDVYKRQGK